MSIVSNLIWINKTPDSSSLSNCGNEKDTFRQIRSHAVTIGHKSSRVKRPIERTPFNLCWTRRNARRSPVHDSCLRSSSQERGDNNLTSQVEVAQPENCTPISLSRLQYYHLPSSSSSSGSSEIFAHALPPLNPLSRRHDPFSSYSISLEVDSTLEHLRYFQNIWSQCAFKLPGCIGYGQSPISHHEITVFIQQCLAYPTRAYCLLAATSARIQYIHYRQQQNWVCGGTEAHRYAAKALQGLRGRLLERRDWEEEEATEVLFLAAYEIYCEDEAAAGKHLEAVGRLYRREISNTFVRRLQANLEILVAKSVAGGWLQEVERVAVEIGSSG